MNNEMNEHLESLDEEFRREQDMRENRVMVLENVHGSDDPEDIPVIDRGGNRASKLSVLAAMDGLMNVDSSVGGYTSSRKPFSSGGSVHPGAGLASEFSRLPNSEKKKIKAKRKKAHNSKKQNRKKRKKKK